MCSLYLLFINVAVAQRNTTIKVASPKPRSV